jgi:hypothetical protein
MVYDFHWSRAFSILCRPWQQAHGREAMSRQSQNCHTMNVDFSLLIGHKREFHGNTDSLGNGSVVSEDKA